MTNPSNTDLIIDSPIGPFSTPGEVRAWVRELETLAADFKEGSDGARTIARERREAEAFLHVAEGLS